MNSNEIIINGVKYIEVLNDNQADKVKEPQKIKPSLISRFFSSLGTFIMRIFHTIIGFAIISIICAILWLAGGSKYFKSIDQQKVEYNEKMIQKAMLENTKYDSIQIAKIHGQEMGESKYSAWVSLRLRQIQGLIDGAKQDVANYKCSEGIGDIGSCPQIQANQENIQTSQIVSVLPKVGLGNIPKNPFMHDNQSKKDFLNQPAPPVVKIAKVEKTKNYDDTKLKDVISNSASRHDEIASIIMNNK